jgi:hypothetical protein
MIKELIRIENSADERQYNLLVTRKSTDDPNLEDVCVDICLTIEERRILIQHLEKIDHIENKNFSITFGVRTNGQDDSISLCIKEFTKRIKDI